MAHFHAGSMYFPPALSQHETAERLEVLRRADRYEQALSVKDQMLWVAMQASKSISAESLLHGVRMLRPPQHDLVATSTPLVTLNTGIPSTVDLSVCTTTWLQPIT